MSDSEDFPALGPDLAQNAELPAPSPNHDQKGRFRPGNRAQTPFARGNALSKKHGLHSRAHAKIDRRRTVDRRVIATLRAIEQKLGERLTPQRAVILANIGRQLRDLATIEAFEERVGIIDKRRRAPWPISEAKWKLLEHVARQLERLGLDGEKKKARSLTDIVATYGSRDPSSDEADEADAPDAAASSGAELVDVLEDDAPEAQDTSADAADGEPRAES